MARTAGIDKSGSGSVAPRGPVVLLVDDEPEWITWLSCYLRDCDWTVLTGSCGIDGLAVYDQSVPDVVIADQKMPGMFGTELAGALRGRGFRGPMLLLSASIDPDTNSECSRLGMHALSKLSHGAIFHTLDLFKQDVLAQHSMGPAADARPASVEADRMGRPLLSV